ncbi:MAG: IS1380 family transposase [Actinobacteria bacterium]|nr:IS1380 family transposase [Actinomycetota bacterium]
MEVTQRVMAVHGDRRVGRIVVRADDPSLTPYAGLAVSGELARRLRLAELIDAELAVERRARPVKVRRRGLSAGELVVSLAECQLVGGSFFGHVEDVRADGASARLRAVAGTPSAATALQNAKRFRRVHAQRVERAMARAGERLDRALGRDAGDPVTVDLDATQVTVYGRRKQGAGRSRHGSMSYAPHVAFWAQRGRALTCELVGGNKEKLSGGACATIARRALRLLPAGHGPVTMRIDSAYYAVELLEALRRENARFTVSVPRNQAMWKALGQLPDGAWSDALDMPGAQVAETTYTPAGWRHEPLRLIVRRVAFSAAEIARLRGSRRLKTIHPDQLALALDGQLEQVHGYSFILTDLPAERDAVWVEHFHRHRAQIEERLKEAKLGQALRHLPSGDEHANRVWLACALLALNLTAWCCDLCPAAGASGKAPDDAPLRRAAHTLRRILFCVPARIVRTARRTILRLPEGFRHANVFTATLDAVYALPPP